jgi:unsaturated rhamnogalacturonyl hydrolase
LTQQNVNLFIIILIFPFIELTLQKQIIKTNMKKILFFIALLVATNNTMAQNAQDVLNVIRKANNYFMQKYEDPTLPTFVKKERPSNLWTRAVYYEGLMALYEIDHNQCYLDYTDKWANFHKWSPRNGIKSTDADDQCCGQTYVDIYQQTGSKDEYKIRPIIQNLDNQMSTGKMTFWTWIDAIQMAMPLYAQIYKVTGERKYIDYAMQMYRWTRNECGGGLFNKKTGYWWRDKDFVPPYQEKDGNYCYWSRGNGWVYAALVRVMNLLPKNGQYYKELKKDYLSMSKAFLRCQRDDGFWNVSLISPTTFGGKELTGTSLFLYGMSWGIRKGLLKSKQYRHSCDKSWKAIQDECVHEDGFLGYVQGTGKEPKDSQPVTYTKVPDFEDFGTGCFLLGTTEYYRLITSDN